MDRLEENNREFKQGRFNRVVHVTGSGRFTFLGSDFSQFFWKIVSTRVKVLSKTHVVASRHIKREEASLPVEECQFQKRPCLSSLLKLQHETVSKHSNQTAGKACLGGAKLSQL